MFKNIFSFKGKIGRKEFLITAIVFFIIAISIQSIGALLIGLKIISEGVIIPIIVLFYLVIIWFLIAQGTKRCHDVGVNPLLQLIPFFYIYLLLAKGRFFETDFGKTKN